MTSWNHIKEIKYKNNLLITGLCKRERNPGTKQDGISKLQHSRMSAREFRVRKKLRYEYLEELLQERERAIASLHYQFDLYRKVCEQIDSWNKAEYMKRLVNSERFIKVEKS